ncbi:hypothetical protein FRC02_001829 [Tulasnella sp. 418]|nr:hypothetical protein FRC02_001829 [Tulasnella sp. 418]
MPTQPAAKDAEEKYERDLRDWKKRDKYARGLIGASVSKSIRNRYLNDPTKMTSKQMWDTLETQFKTKSPLIFYHYFMRYLEFSWDTSQTARANINVFLQKARDLEMIGRGQSDEELAIIIAMKLPKTPRWEIVTTQVLHLIPEPSPKLCPKCTKNSPTTSSSTPPKFTFEVIEKIILNEDARDAEYNTGNSGQAMLTQKKKGKGKSSNKALKVKSPPVSKASTSPSNPDCPSCPNKCNYCKHTGHCKKHCYQKGYDLYNSLSKKEKSKVYNRHQANLVQDDTCDSSSSSEGSFALMCNAYHVSEQLANCVQESETWIIDSGTTSHVCKNLAEFSTYRRTLVLVTPI